MSRNASRSFERQPTVLDWEREVWRLNQEVKGLKFPPSHIQAYVLEPQEPCGCRHTNGWHMKQPGVVDLWSCCGEAVKHE